ncbi:hypothetical protein GWI33_012903 [Rhynchophorus ferrugineus]|uniref:PiggyBac transposable element-derived protein domain-containing protein n=1 Tax=Rhynchophorus ferrugineus TaxID=354439 RepID=A0A834MAI0_RHYFE|nr:hypothetical protein GWI33_012903 [Rhynchophorus ferrugineus]
MEMTSSSDETDVGTKYRDYSLCSFCSIYVGHDTDVESRSDLEHKENQDEIIHWTNKPVGMMSYLFTKTEELMIRPTETTPIVFFRLLVTDGSLTNIVEQTNKYATEIFQSPGLREKSRITSWKDLTPSELLVILGIFLHMGNVKLRCFQDYWKKDPFFHQEAISKSPSRNRFLIALRALHFSRNP